MTNAYPLGLARRGPYSYEGRFNMRRLRKKRVDRRGILALAHRGVIHVRGEDCVHPDIGLVTSG